MAETMERKAQAYDQLVALMRAGHVLAMVETIDDDFRVRAVPAGTLAGLVETGATLADAVEAVVRQAAAEVAA